MTVVTVRADRRAHVPAGHGFRVHALSIRQERAIANAAALHHRFVAVTSSAGLGEIRAIDGRFRVAGREDRRQVAIPCMAVKTGRAFRSVMNRLRMKSTIIGSMWRV